MGVIVTLSINHSTNNDMCTTNTTTRTKHNDTCSMAFGKPSKHDTCPRCNELKQGAKPRAWKIPIQQPALTDTYCFSVAIYHSRCTKDTNPKCACGKMSYTD